MALNIRRLGDETDKPAQSIMVWGASGSGKTVFMGTAGSESLFINNGDGAETLRSKWFKTKYPNYRPQIVDIPLDNIDNSLDPMKAETPGMLMLNEAFQYGMNEPTIKTICLDDSTAFSALAMIHAMKYNYVENKSKTINSAKKYEVIIPAVQDYGVQMDMVKQYYAWMISETKKHGKNLIVGAHIRRIFKAAKKIGEQPEHVADVPAFTGADKNPDAIAGLFDWVFFSQSKGTGERTQYSLRSEGDETLTAKTRHKGIVPPLWIDPDFQVLLEKMK